MTEHVSHLVIGGGAMGLATAWRLAERGHSPVVLERFARGHGLGASHGAARNFNNAYAEPHYLDLLASARQGWDDLGRTTGEPLLRLHGLATHGDDAAVAEIATALAARGAHAEVWPSSQAAARWPGMRFDGDVLVSNDAGVVRSEAALRAMEQATTTHGGDVRFEHRVVALEDTGDGVDATVEHAGERYRIHAETVVVTVGAWTEVVLGATVALPRLTVTEESPAHFLERKPGAQQWPSFNHLLDPARGAYPGNVYGMPTPGEGIKVGFHRVGETVDPDERPFRSTPRLVSLLDDYVREWMPGLLVEGSAAISCTYTSTDSGDFVLDRRGRIVVGAGFSGHGFKFTPAIGSVLADLATDPSAAAPAPFRLDRAVSSGQDRPRSAR
ncbi:FAD-dependent oxidoreductase [Microbacterium sp. Root61]|uniref:FAD-dependent oxidoreductase n=1 Tax=Microbacterium sp. Root61 TaxID=1736570 RepID=UPI0006F56FAD|nr:FAD-dependent oxidoreductase [Microbacterium sp. Root61]KRA25741.1 FAD-dependent oxidoreductase [Microbacterium sp. Root61]